MTNKLVIRVLFLGLKSQDIDLDRLCKWKSELWEIQGGKLEPLSVPLVSDLDNWGYSDELLLRHLPVQTVHQRLHSALLMHHFNSTISPGESLKI